MGALKAGKTFPLCQREAAMFSGAAPRSLFSVLRHLRAGPACFAREELGWSSASAAQDSPRSLTTQGMELFKKAEVAKSVAAFDRAIELDERYKGVLWQRGLSLYYADRFKEASEQFIRDVALNPRDTEEAVWNLLAQARAEGGSWEQAQEQLIAIKGETRPYMQLVYEVCAGKASVATLQQIADTLLPPIDAKSSPAPPSDVSIVKRFKDTMRPLETGFYLNLYAGLIAEAQSRSVEAQRYMLKAARSEYGASDDYMWHLARVHCLTRHWPLD